MNWLLKFRIRENLQHSVWFIPLLMFAVAMIVGQISWRIDRAYHWELLGFESSGAVAAMATIVGAMITFTGLIFSIMLVAVQFASSQLTPRVLKTSFDDPVVKFSLGLFIFTFIQALIAMSRISENFIPQLAILMALILVLSSILAFLLLIHHVTYSLRAVTICSKVGLDGFKVIERMFPEKNNSSDSSTKPNDDGPKGTPTRTVNFKGKSGVVMAIDTRGLIEEAKRKNGVIVFAPSVGDFISTGSPLFHLFENDEQIDAGLLSNSVAVGPERTMEQDPAYAFRILVDIALKALSSGINDPTTAVVAIDQIHGLLSKVSPRQLDAGEYYDNENNLRFEIQTPAWEDFLSLAVDEIRIASNNSLQIVRRLRAMLEDVFEVVSDHQREAVKNQIELLDRTIERNFSDPEDREKASISDYQGVGSSRTTGHRRNN